MFTLIHQGEYPLYDFTVRVVDVKKFEERVQKSHSLLDMQKDETHLSVGNVAPHQASMVGPFEIRSEFIRLNLFFSARNGFFNELLRVQRVKNEWKTALKVTKYSTSGSDEVLFEKVDSGYPLGKDGRVEWQ